MNNIEFSKAYQRLFGFVFSEDEIAILRKKVICVAGCGGVGGKQAVSLGRYGVGEIRLSDPGIFDAPDLNRQYGAKASTLNRNKADITGADLKDAAPFTKVKIYNQKDYSFDEFLDGADLAIDAIDYLTFKEKMNFFKKAREKGIPVLSAPIPIASTILMTFLPEGMTAEEYFMAPKDESKWTDYRFPFERIYPFNLDNNQREILEKFYNKQAPLSTNASSGDLSAGLLSMEAVLLLTKKIEPTPVPFIKYISLYPEIKAGVYSNMPDPR